MREPKQARQRKRGFAIILTTLTLFVTIPLAGLAIDLSTLYFIQTKLSVALDAAVLAGARGLSLGADQAAQTASAQQAAQQFFNANFPFDKTRNIGYWGTINVTFAPPTVNNSGADARTVSAVATAQAPLYFMRFLGQNYSTVAASAQASRRDAVVMLVLDRSGSMNWGMGGGNTACDVMVQDAVNFLDNFTIGRDAVGLVVFDTNVFTQAPTTNFSNLAAEIKTLTCGGGTGTASALSSAYTLLKASPFANANTANFIVLETDGRPNAVYADYTAYETPFCHPLPPFAGLITPFNGGVITNNTTGGLLSINNNSISNPGSLNWASSQGGCQSSSHASSVVTRMPNNDFMNHPLRGDYYGNINNAYSLLSPDPDYQNQLPTLANVDVSRDIVRAAANSVDNMAWQVRTDPYRITIMSIGLAGTAGTSSGADGPDTALLRKIANDPSMQNDPSLAIQGFYTGQKGQPQGYFALAPDPSQLDSAFNAIASQIVLRLSN